MNRFRVARPETYTGWLSDGKVTRTEPIARVGVLPATRIELPIEVDESGKISKVLEAGNYDVTDLLGYQIIDSTGLLGLTMDNYEEEKWQEKWDEEQRRTLPFNRGDRAFMADHLGVLSRRPVIIKNVTEEGKYEVRFADDSTKVVNLTDLSRSS